MGKTKTCSYADALLLFGRERKRSRVFSTLLSVSFVCVLLFVVSSLSSSSSSDGLYDPEDNEFARQQARKRGLRTLNSQNTGESKFDDLNAIAGNMTT